MTHEFDTAPHFGETGISNASIQRTFGLPVIAFFSRMGADYGVKQELC